MRKLLIGLLLIAIAVPLGFGIAGWVDPHGTAKFVVSLERKGADLREKTVEIPGFKIHYLEGGSGEPLLMIHGFGANKDNWTRIARYLTPHYRVIAPDLPGFGESSKPADAGYRYDDQLPRIQAFAEALGLKRYHVAGNSMGGYFAAGLAQRYPESVASAWLLAPGGVQGGQPSEMMQRIAAGEDVPLLAQTPAQFDRILDFVFADPPYLPGFYRGVLAEQAIAAYPLNKQIFHQIRFESPALEKEIAGLNTPLLISWGELDRVLHVSGAQVLDQVLPNATVIRMPEIGHLPMVEAPRQAAKDYLEWRQSLQGDQP